MSSGSNEVITYSEIAAYQADQGVATYADGSGGYTTGGIWINWDQTGGFSGAGWKMEDSMSPAYGWDQSRIDLEIQQNGDLDEMFKQWIANHPDYESRYNWIFNHISSGCRFEVIS